MAFPLTPDQVAQYFAAFPGAQHRGHSSCFCPLAHALKHYIGGKWYVTASGAWRADTRVYYRHERWSQEVMWQIDRVAHGTMTGVQAGEVLLDVREVLGV